MGSGRRVRQPPGTLPTADRALRWAGNLTRGPRIPAHHRQRRSGRAGSGHRPARAPRVDKDGNGRPVGEPDTRPAGRRRGEALIEALRRSVTVTHPDTATPTANPKAMLLITLDFETLAARYGAAHVVGTRADGMLLGCDTVRKLACDAAIIPVSPRRRRGRPGPRAGEAVVHHRPDPRPLATRPALHLPRMRRPRSLVRRAPPCPLDRRRPHGPDQRRPALRPPPHHRPPRPAGRHPHRPRCAVGPATRVLPSTRPAPRMAGQINTGFGPPIAAAAQGPHRPRATPTTQIEHPRTQPSTAAPTRTGARRPTCCR